jgi:agmatinase
MQGMSTRRRYEPVDARITPRFAGVRTFARLPHVREDLTDVDVAVLGFPFDTATSFRTGTRFGPEAIRSASALLRPYNAHQRIDVFEQLNCVDGGDVGVLPGDTVGTLERAQREFAQVIGAGVIPLTLGGDHSITLSELRALAAVHGPLGIVQLDAHTDTWDSYFGQRYYHGTTFRRAAEEGVIDASSSVQAGIRGPLYSAADLDEARELGFAVVPADELRELTPARYGELVRERVGDRPAFISFDVDFCDPAFAPGTGTPEVGGFSSAEAQALVRSLRGLRLVGADVVEVSPAYDSPGQPTALLASNIAWEILALIAASAAESDACSPGA